MSPLVSVHRYESCLLVCTYSFNIVDGVESCVDNTRCEFMQITMFKDGLNFWEESSETFLRVYVEKSVNEGVRLKSKTSSISRYK